MFFEWQIFYLVSDLILGSINSVNLNNRLWFYVTEPTPNLYCLKFRNLSNKVLKGEIFVIIVMYLKFIS